MAETLLAAARDFERRGADEQAREAYLAWLSANPDDREALFELANLALRTGYRSAACTAYRRLVQLAPDFALAHVGLGNALLAANDLANARAAYEAAIARDPSQALAHQGLSYVYARLGNDEDARSHRERGFRGHALTIVPYRGTLKPRRVLVLFCAAGGNFYTDWLIDDRHFAVSKLAVEYADPAAPLPEHDLVVNSAADADRCGEALRACARIEAQSGAGVVNPASTVLDTGRARVAQRLAGISGLVVPRAEPVSRTELETDGSAALQARGFEFPLLLRSLGHHTGRHFVKVDSPEDVPAAAAALPGASLLAIAYVDTRAADGRFRKYRVIAIQKELYALHAAVSDHWKVHYATAGMDREAWRREEEARFLSDPEREIGSASMNLLRSIAIALDIDYMGVDFALDSSGRVVVFEANAAMSMYGVDPGTQRDYRRPAADRIFRAFGELMNRRSRRRSGP